MLVACRWPVFPRSRRTMRASKGRRNERLLSRCDAALQTPTVRISMRWRDPPWNRPALCCAAARWAVLSYAPLGFASRALLRCVLGFRQALLTALTPPLR